MFKRVSVLLIALTVFLSMTACSMPDSIFPEEAGLSSGDETEHVDANVYDFIFTIDGQEFSLPEKYSVLSARGWNLEEPDVDEEAEAKAKDNKEENEDEKVYTPDTVMAPGEYSEYIKAVKEDMSVELKFYNDTKKDAALKNCNVVGINLNSDNSKNPTIQLVGGVKLGSAYETVADTYGRPSYEKNFLVSDGDLAAIDDVEFIETSGEKTRVLYYSLNEHSFVEFTLGDYQGEDEAAVGIKIENDVEPEDEYDYTKDMKKVPEEVELYKGPNLLGKKFSDFAFKYEGNLYTLPIPVRELIDDGWEFVRGASLRVQRGNTEGGVVLRKGNLAVTVIVHNYDMKNIHTPINCYAVSLSASVIGPNVSIMLPKGVSLGSDESELIAAYGSEYSEEQTDDDTDEEADENAADDTEADVNTTEEACYIEKTEYEDYTVYSYIMPDDVPSVELPVSITDIGDTKVDLLGKHRKHIDVYVSNVNHKVVHIYMQNCPEYIVDEAKIWEQQLENANKNQ